MARSKRIKETAAGVAFYHVISRTNNRMFLFDSADTKDALVTALKRSAAFSGVSVEAYAVMDNHVHAVVKVTRLPVSDPNDNPASTGSVPSLPSLAEAIPEAELLRRVEILKGAESRRELEDEWRELRKAGLFERLEREQNRLQIRMNDVSEFVKTFKETFDRVYKKNHEYHGSIWSGRFKSTLVEGGEYLARCRKYVYFNPVRAGIVTQAAAYRWAYDCSLNEAGENATGLCETTDVATDSATSPTGTDPGSGDAAAGPVPKAWWMRKVAQIGSGKLFGSMAFVKRKASGLGHLFPAKRVMARPVGEIGFATHGWRLANADEERREREVA